MQDVRFASIYSASYHLLVKSRQEVPNMKKSVNTGVSGLDELLDGGLPEGSVTVLSGPPGVGKSTIAMQYLYEGVQKGEPGLLLSIESNTSDALSYASAFNWDFDKYVKEGKLMILDRSIFEESEMQLSHDFGALRDIMKEMKPKRFVVDSVTFFDFLFRDEIAKKMNIMRFIDLMKTNDCTTIMTLKQSENFPNIQYNEWHFLSDGLLAMFWNRNHAENERCIWAVKMRERNIDTNIHPIKITEKGVVIYTNDVPSITAP